MRAGFWQNSEMIREWLSQIDPEHLRRMVYLGQVILGGTLIAILLYFRSRPNQLSFRVFEADLKKNSKRGSAQGRPELLNSHSKYEKPSTNKKQEAPLRLTGVVTTGAPHEILGIPARSDATQIQKAFRELMKRYHPDKVGPAGSREWKDAQRIADAIIRAKEEMLNALNSAAAHPGEAGANPAKDPKRSGR